MAATVTAAPPAITADALRAMIGDGNPPRLFDVRKRPAYDADDTVIEGAVWRDHAAVGDWAAEAGAASAVVCCCVHGHEVSQGAVAGLRRLGIDARYLVGGIEAWKAAGGALAPKP